MASYFSGLWGDEPSSSETFDAYPEYTKAVSEWSSVLDAERRYQLLADANAPTPILRTTKCRRFLRALWNKERPDVRSTSRHWRVEERDLATLGLDSNDAFLDPFYALMLTVLRTVLVQDTEDAVWRNWSRVVGVIVKRSAPDVRFELLHLFHLVAFQELGLQLSAVQPSTDTEVDRRRRVDIVYDAFFANNQYQRPRGWPLQLRRWKYRVPTPNVPGVFCMPSLRDVDARRRPVSALGPAWCPDSPVDVQAWTISTRDDAHGMQPWLRLLVELHQIDLARAYVDDAWPDDDIAETSVHWRRFLDKLPDDLKNAIATFFEEYVSEINNHEYPAEWALSLREELTRPSVKSFVFYQLAQGRTGVDPPVRPGGIVTERREQTVTLAERLARQVGGTVAEATKPTLQQAQQTVKEVAEDTQKRTQDVLQSTKSVRFSLYRAAAGITSAVVGTVALAWFVKPTVAKRRPNTVQ